MSMSPETVVSEYSGDEDSVESVHCEIKCSSFLGAGTSGSVKSVAHESAIDGKEYAIKTVELNGAEPPAHVLAECGIHALLPPSDTIVRYHFSWQMSGRLHILLERVDGELWDELCKPEVQLVDAAERLDWIRHLLMAVDTLHASNIAHRDISPWNCFLASSEPVSHRRLKLGDFGLACRLLPARSDAARSEIFGMEEPEGFAPLDESAVGSLYSAPELGAETGYAGKEVDIFSSGMTIFAIWHAVLVARAQSKAWEGTANLPQAQTQSATAHTATQQAVETVTIGWEDELVSCVENLKADGKSLPRCWAGAGPMAELVTRMVSHDARARPTARECLELLSRVQLPLEKGHGGGRDRGSRSFFRTLLRWLSGSCSSRVQPHHATDSAGSYRSGAHKP